jgi:hypothetical protein
MIAKPIAAANQGECRQAGAANASRSNKVVLGIDGVNALPHGLRGCGQ